MAEKASKKIIAQNRKARHDYFVDERYEAGIAWYCDVFSACALALDYEETLPYVDVLSLKETVDAALRESKSGTGRAGAFQLDTSIDAEEMCVTTFRSIS